MPSERVETINTSDGGAYDGWLFVPDRGHGPGIVLLQEIFGVGDFLRAKADDLAALGYVVLCPDVFWRTEPHVAHDHDEAGLQAAFASMTRWSQEVDELTAGADLLSAFEHLRGLPDVGARAVGVMGYCLGGRLAYELAVAGQPDACVSYYGSGIGGRLDDADRITCPTLFHYGGEDPFIPGDEVEAVQKAFAGRDDVEVHVHAGAGHAFENHEAEMFYSADATATAWRITTDFLARTLSLGSSS
jgi:carboxymethylenebutenolidase